MVSLRRMYRVMTFGSRGNDVTQLQNALRNEGLDPGASDGIFGRRTASAVRQLQQQRGIGVDGIVGPDTQRVLQLRNSDTFEARPAATTSAATPQANGSIRQRLAYAMRRAVELGLRITSTTGGRHAPRSFHYVGRAVDVAGSRPVMRQFYREMARLNPTELFHDPIGGIKRGRQTGPIGGHRNHVHVAF
jgi:peptidoglycan hydrolase-like protein with peptidoglycan-binding domain